MAFGQGQRQSYADSLRVKVDVSILLQPPSVHVIYDPARVKGNPDAPLALTIRWLPEKLPARA
jgi:hypothetical protein